MKNTQSKSNVILFVLILVVIVLLLFRIVQVWYFSSLYLKVDQILDHTQTIEDSVVSEDPAEPLAVEAEIPAEPEPELTTEIVTDSETVLTTEASTMFDSINEAIVAVKESIFLLLPFCFLLSFSSSLLRLIKEGS